MQACVLSHFSGVWLFVTPWTIACQTPLPCKSPSKNTGVGHPFLLQGIIPTQGSNPGLTHRRWTPYHMSHQGSLSVYFSKLAYDYIFLKKFLEDEWMSFFLIAGAYPTRLLYSWLYWTTCFFFFFLEISSSLSFCHPVSVVFLSDLPISGFSIDWPWLPPTSVFPPLPSSLLTCCAIPPWP